MSWFARDYTGRKLSRQERTFLDALRALLTEVRPPQLDPSETALTSEGTDCLIALLPHRALGGITIVVYLYADRADVSWARVSHLELHDDLDAGVRVAHFPLEKPDPDFGSLLQSLRTQFAAPVVLRCYGTERATAHVADHAGSLRRIGDVGRTGGWLHRLGRGHSDQVIVRFNDLNPPPVTASSGVDRWFAPDGRGA